MGGCLRGRIWRRLRGGAGIIDLGGAGCHWGLGGVAAAGYGVGAGPVAQLDRALPSEGRGRTFESCRVRQFLLVGCVMVRQALARQRGEFLRQAEEHCQGTIDREHGRVIQVPYNLADLPAWR